MTDASPEPVHCHCGAVALRLAVAPRAPINCHCRLCRHLSGAAFTTWVTAKATEVAVDGECHLTAYHPTDKLERLFCKRCGTHVFTKDKRHPGVLGLPAGLLDDLNLQPPQGEYFVSDKARWFTPGRGLPCFGGSSGFEPLDA